jgi:phage terminase small subunit
VPLPPRQRLFVSEYLKDLNATQAAIRAGYSKKTAYSQGFDLLRKPNVAKAVAEYQRGICDKIGLGVEECYAILAHEAREAEASKDRIAATLALLKYQHKIADKVEHSGEVSVSIRVVDPYAEPVGGGDDK